MQAKTQVETQANELGRSERAPDRRASTLRGGLLAGTLGVLLIPVVAAAAPGDNDRDKAPRPPLRLADAAGDKDKAGGKEKPTGMVDAFAAAPAPAQAPAAPSGPASFDELVKAAVPVKDVATLIEPLYARCDDADALARRQCEGEKAYLLDYLKAHTFVADADVQPETTPYDAAAKQVDMEVPGCVYCKDAPVVAGEPRYLTTRPAQRLAQDAAGTRAVVPPVASHEISIEDRTKADRFVERVVPRLRVQHVFKIGLPYGDAPAVTAPAAKPAAGAAASPPLSQIAQIKGVLITSLGHRVYDRCTGQIAAATPKVASPVKVKPDRSCPITGAEELSAAELKKQAEIDALPERLMPREIDQVLAPIQAKMHECYVEFGEPSGTAKVSLTIGGEGKLTGLQLPPPFDKADIGVCLRSQLKSAVFPKFRGSPMNVEYVYQVQ
ncbi:MAG: hypothetical protein U1A78_06195 [Polyangia bacterium]